MSAQPSAYWQPHTPPVTLERILEASAKGERLYPNLVSDAEIDDAILREAIKHFSLYEADALKAEAEYGLPPAQQVAIGIRSAPHRVACIFAEHAIRKRFGDQSSHLAPLYRDADGLRLNLPTSGLIVPTLRAGFMRVWLHYKTPEDRRPRWITSSHLPGGSKVEPSIHIVGAEHAHTSRVALVVNHALEAEGMAAGGILTVIGLILAYMNATQDWPAWAFAWPLVAPGGVGLGIYLQGLRKHDSHLLRQGRVLMFVAALIFMIGFVIFGTIFKISEVDYGWFGKAALPVLLIVVGIVLLVRSIRRSRSA